MAAGELIGTRIVKRRHQLGLSQEQLAERIGVHRDSVSKWESGRHYPHRHLGKLEAVLGISLSEDDQDPAAFVNLNDPDELRIWSWDDLPAWKRREWIADLRAARRRRDPA